MWWVAFCTYVVLALRAIEAFQFTSIQQFDAAVLTNPQSTASQVETQLTFTFDHTDATAFLDGVNGYCWEQTIPTNISTVIDAKVCANWGPYIIVRENTILGTIPMKTFKIQSFVRSDRSNQWFVAAGNIQQDPNVQSVFQTLGAANGTANAEFGRRLLSMIDGALESDVHINRLHESFFTTKRSQLNQIPLQMHPTQKALHTHFQKVRTFLEQNTHSVLGSMVMDLSSTKRRLMDQGIPTFDQNPVTFSPTAAADINQFQPALGAFLTSPALTGANGFISQATGVLGTLGQIANTTYQTLVVDDQLIDNTANVTGQEFLAFQQQQNLTQTLQIAALAQNAATTQLANNRTAWIQQSENEQLQFLNNQLLVLKLGNDVRYNASAQWVNALQLATTLFGLTSQTNYITLQNNQNVADVANQQITSFYVKTPERRAQTLNYHQLAASGQSLGYKIVQSSLNPPQAPLGRVPLSSNNIGYMFRQTTIYTTVQTPSSIPYYNDVDMANVPNYNSPSLNPGIYNPYSNLIKGTHNLGAVFLHKKEESIFCSNEWLLSQQNTIFKYYDLLVAIGPSGCTPYVNCHCWNEVNRQRCASYYITGAEPGGVPYPTEITATSFPAPFNNVWDLAVPTNTGSSRCAGGTAGGQTESEGNGGWFSTTSTTGLTGRLNTEILTNASLVTLEIQSDCTYVLSHTPQTSANVVPGPYNPLIVYQDYGQMTAPTNSTLAALVVPNNYLYCGTDPQVMMDQTRRTNATSGTLPYAFIAGFKFGLQSLLASITGAWGQQFYGGDDINVGRYTKPFHTVPQEGTSGSGSMLIYATEIAFTSLSAIPVTLMNTLGKGIAINITITAGGVEYASFPLTGNQIVDLSPPSYSFPDKEFLFVHFKDCLRIPGGCPSMDPGIIPDGLNYGLDLPYGTTRTLSASNTTQLNARGVGALFDPRASVAHSPFIVCPWSFQYAVQQDDPLNPGHPNPAYDPRCNNPLFPPPLNASPPQYFAPSNFPPVIDIDDYNAFFGLTYFDPSVMVGDSAHWYMVQVVQNLKGELDVLAPAYQSSNTDVFPKGTLSMLLEAENPVGLSTADPWAMDAYELSIFYQRKYSIQGSVTIPGTYVGAVGPLISVCPPPFQMYLNVVPGAWVSLYIANGYSYPLNVSVSFVSFEDPTCNVVDEFTIPVATGTTPSVKVTDVPTCIMQNFTVSSWDPVSQSLQECWFFFGNMTQVFLDQYQPPTNTSVFNAGSSESLLTSPVTQDIVNSADFQYKLNLYEQQLISLQGLRMQLPIFSAMAGTINGLPPVAGDGSVTTSIAQLAALSSHVQDSLNLNNLVNTLLVQSTAAQYANTVTQNGLSSAVGNAIAGAVAAQQNFSNAAAQAATIIQNNAGLLANLTGPQQAQNLLDLKNKNAYLQIEVEKAELANATLLLKSPLIIGGHANVPMDWPSTFTAWTFIVDFFKDIFNDIKDLIAFLINLVEHPCSIGGIPLVSQADSLICSLFDIWKWIIIIAIVIACVIGLVLFCNVYSKLKSNKTKVSIDMLAKQGRMAPMASKAAFSEAAFRALRADPTQPPEEVDAEEEDQDVKDIENHTRSEELDDENPAVSLLASTKPAPSAPLHSKKVSRPNVLDHL